MPTSPELRVVDDPVAACARSIGRRLGAAVRRHGRASLAVSGGSTAPPMFAVLAGLDVPWSKVGVWQVDERVAPDGHADRNANQIGGLAGRHHVMTVTAADLEAAAGRYARSLPERFDVVHLGMGDDGHAASWPPGDPVADRPEPVAISLLYQGRVRMTLTPTVVNGAIGRVVLVTGASKGPALAAWLNPILMPRMGHRWPNPGMRMTDPPIARLRRSGTVVFADAEAASDLGAPS